MNKELKELALHAAKGTAPANYTVETVNNAFVGELSKIAHDYYSFRQNEYAVYEILSYAIDEIVPKNVISTVGMFAEVQVVGQGQKVSFKRRLGKNRAKKFLTQVGLSGVYETFRLDTETFDIIPHAVGGAISLDYERMLDGAETLAELMEILTEGLTNSVFVEIQRALRAALDAKGRPDANKVTGSGFDADEMVKLVGTVKNYGNGAAIFATHEFISAMGPDAIVPVSGSVAGVYHPQDIDRIHNYGLINIFRGTPVIELPQSFVDENNVKTWLDPQMAYVLPTGGEKVVKVVLEGQTIMYSETNRDNSIEINAYRKLAVAILSHYNWGIYQNTEITQTLEEPYANL